MSANVPTDICFSFRGLMRRGGDTGPHRDGWGIAFYEGRGYRAFRDHRPCAESEVARLVERYPIRSHVVVSHIRRANRGGVRLENTHPFNRELWGRNWAFAHNGQLVGIKRKPLGNYRPVGTTDSEHAFCWMLEQIRARFPKSPSRPSSLWRLVAKLAAPLHESGVCNFLLSDGRALYAHCSTKLCWITRRAPFGRAELADADWAVDFAAVTTPRDIVTVIATLPLTTNERWQIMQPGELVVFVDGEVTARYLSGRPMPQLHTPR
jgi:glutamine amidotransferase